jgi:hypothetical protein
LRLARTRLGALYFVLVSALAAVACTSDLELALDGKACKPGPRPCLGGYVCEAQSQRCVLAAELAAGGAGSGEGGAGGGDGTSGASAQAGAGGAVTAGGAGMGGSGQGGAAGGTAGASGSGGRPGDAGALGDAGPLADAGCGVVLYRDGDSDGVGDIANSRVGCPAPGWVTQPGDCRDDLPEVFLGQLLFFAEPYSDVAGASFDYDCSNVEEPDPSNSPLTAPPDCAGLSVTCAGSGYLPASPLRSGVGIEPRCGSNLRRDCVTVPPLGCGSQDSPLDPSLTFRCR